MTDSSNRPASAAARRGRIFANSRSGQTPANSQTARKSLPPNHRAATSRSPDGIKASRMARFNTDTHSIRIAAISPWSIVTGTSIGMVFHRCRHGNGLFFFRRARDASIGHRKRSDAMRDRTKGRPRADRHGAPRFALYDQGDLHARLFQATGNLGHVVRGHATTRGKGRLLRAGFGKEVLEGSHARNVALRDILVKSGLAVGDFTGLAASCNVAA